MTDKHIIDDYEDFKEQADLYRKQLKEERIKNSQAFDKNLMLISSGGLALSMTFVEKIGGEDPSYLLFLICSWCSFGATLLLSLTANLAIVKAATYEQLALEAAEDHRENTIEEFKKDISDHRSGVDILVEERRSNASMNMNFRARQVLSVIKYQRKSSIYLFIGQLLPPVAYSLLMIGALSLITFASLNVLKTKKENPQSTTVSVSEQKEPK